MPKFKTLPEEKKGNEALRIHCALTIARMKLAGYFYAHGIKPGDDFPQDQVFKLAGAGEETSDMAYLWTALMIMGQLSGRKGFSAKNIDVINVASVMGEKNDKRFFDPKSQLKKTFFSYDYTSLNSSSLYETVFRPFVEKNELSYDEDERSKFFGSQVSNNSSLELDVQFHMVDYMMHAFFLMDKRSVKYRGTGDELCRKLHNIGAKKLAHMVRSIDPDKINEVNFSSMKMNEFGKLDVCFIIDSCKVKTIILDSNSLHRLDPTGKKNHTYLCLALSEIPKSVRLLSLRNNGLSSFNKTELLEIMQAIPSTVTEVIIECNKLDPELEQELLHSRGQKTQPLPKPTQSVKNQKPKLEKPKEEKPVKLSSISQAHFSKQTKASSSAPKEEASSSSAPSTSTKR
ncbi:MAG: hypothetical protein P4L79_13385 [Legionella sp.]|uniref:hypothetical protein n=1 Tax=Legionella sp. TaxID=459 RepID=UPI00283B94F8|nr:hypothetical protein [Legionella sp.]